MDDLAGDRESLAVATYLADKERSLQLIRWLLKTIRVWPRSSEASIVGRALSEFLILACNFFIFSTMIPCGLAVFIEGRENIELRVLHMGPFIYWVMSSMKYFCLLLHVDDIRSCVEYIEADWRIVKSGADREVMLRSAKLGRFIAAFITALMHIGVQFYNITRYLPENVVNIGNSSVLIHELPYPFYQEILDTRFSPSHEVMLIIQIISSFLVSGVTVAICAMTAVFVMHACGQLKILMMQLDNIVDSDIDVKTVQRRLGFIVEHHLRVINFISHLEEIIYLTCLIELVGVSFLLCLLGYCSIMVCCMRLRVMSKFNAKNMKEWNQNRKQNIPKYCMICLALMFNLFILCYISEILSEQYRKVGMASYMTKWYRLPQKTALGLLLINLRSNSFNITLTAGKMIEMSLATFGNVLKVSLTYFNMLRAMTL